MNPYEILSFNFDRIEREDTDEQIKKVYLQNKNELEKRRDILLAKYNFPKDFDYLEEIDFQKLISLVDLEKESIEGLEEKYNKVRDIMKRLLDTDKAYEMIKTSELRLAYACEYEKATSGGLSNLIANVEYVPIEMQTNSSDNFNMQKVGKLTYTNWTGVYIGYTIKYKMKDVNGNEQFVFSEISEEEMNNPKFMEFLNRTILNNRYVEYAVRHNGGYLGVPKKTENGEYIIEFDSEEIAAAKKYQELIQKGTEEDKEKPEKDDLSL